MICELIMIGTLAIQPCQVDMLKMSYKEPESRCYVKMKDGTQHNIKKPCSEVYEVIVQEPDAPEWNNDVLMEFNV